MNRRRWLAAGLAGLALAAAALFLWPRYEAFAEEDYKETCEQAMFMTGIWYQYAIQESLEEGKTEQEIDYEDLLRRVIQAHFELTLRDDLSSSDFCRSGAKVQMSIDPDTHVLTMSCSHEGHEHAYDNSWVTEDVLEQLENIDSGIDVTQ